MSHVIESMQSFDIKRIMKNTVVLAYASIWRNVERLTSCFLKINEVGHYFTVFFSSCLGGCACFFNFKIMKKSAELALVAAFERPFALMTTLMWIQDASKSLERVLNAFEDTTLCLRTKLYIWRAKFLFQGWYFCFDVNFNVNSERLEVSRACFECDWGRNFVSRA